MTCLTKAAALLATLALPATPLTAQAKHTLRTTPVAGTSIWFVETSHQAHDMNTNGIDLKVKAMFRCAFTLTVRQVDKKGFCIVEVHVRRVNGYIELPGSVKRAFDSLDTDPDGDEQLGPQFESMKAAVDRKFVARIDQHGRVHGTLDAVAKHMQGEKPMAMWNSGSLRRLLESTFGQLPDKDVAIGESWQHERHSPAGMLPISEQAEIELQKIDDDAVTTKISGKVVKTPDEILEQQPKEEKQSAYAKADVDNGKLRGSQRISRQDGFVLSSRLDVEADLDTNKVAANSSMHVVIATTLERSTEKQAMRRDDEANDDKQK